MIQADDHESNLRRLVVLIQEAGFPVVKTSKSNTVCHAFSSKHARMSLDLAQNAAFVWLGVRIETGMENLPLFESGLHECMLVSRTYGCSCTPSSSPDKLVLELGLPLFFRGMTYYALIDAVDHVDSAVLACTRILDPRYAQEAHYGNS